MAENKKEESPAQLNFTDEMITNLQSVIPSSCTEVRLLAKGRRGVIFRAVFQDKDVILKVQHPDSKAKNALVLEASYLERVNELGLGPKLVGFTDKFVMMEFIPGISIGQFLKEEIYTKESLLEIFQKVINQMIKLDKAGLNKFEMTNPYKHIIITPDLHPVLIDFERARFSDRPKNLNQFIEYFSQATVLDAFKKVDISLRIEKLKLLLRNYQDAKVPVLLKDACA